MANLTNGIMENIVRQDMSVSKAVTPRSETNTNRKTGEMGCIALIRSDAAAWAGLWKPQSKENPSTTTVLRLLFNYAGLRATAVYRVAHALWKAKVPILPGMLQRMNIMHHG